MASRGRGPDTTLVHMAPGEVRSLQQLAKAHGGSLTINPATGLPEAGFLSSILPMVIGAGLTAASGGTLTPLMAAMITGGGYAAATGSLQKGLAAGFGAYGGAGIGGALAGAGATTAGASAGALGVPGAATGAGSQAAMLAAQNQGFGQAGLEALGSSAGVASGATPIVQSGLQSMGAGIQGLGSEAGRAAFMQNIGGAKGLGMAGIAAASPMMTPTVTKQPEIKTDTDMGQRYSYSPGAVGPTPTPDVPGYGAQGQDFGKEQTYFKPQYTQVSNEAARSMYGYANGGPVEAMSNANAIGANTGYPQSDVRTGAYASPIQRPIGQDVITGAQDAEVNPYTGQAQFADGGSVGGYTYDQTTGRYSGGIPREDTSSGGVLSRMFNQESSSPAAQYSYDPATQKYTRAAQTPITAAQMAGLSALGGEGGGGDYAFDNMGQGYVTGVSSATTGYGNPGESESISDQSSAGASDAGTGYGTGDSSGGFGEGQYKRGGMTHYAKGGISDLGSYSDGGRLLRGPGDGVSDDIPAMIGKKQPARLADGEFVVPARIVSELGNGSTEAGARKLYAMMDRVQKARGKTVGKGKIATNSRAAKHLPA